MASDTLNFANLPLLRVEYALTFEEVRPPSLDQIIAIRQALSSELPIVSDFAGAGGPVNLPVGIGLGAGFDDIERGIGLALRENRIFVAWQKLRDDISYEDIRFPVLRSLLSRAVSVIEAGGQKLSFAKAIGKYVNLVPAVHGPSQSLLHPSLFPHLLPEDVPASDVRCRWNFDGVEYRLDVYKIAEDSVIETTCMCEANIQDPMKSIDQTHTFLNQRFRAIISEEAKDVWKLERP